MLAVTQPIPLPALPSITTRVATMDDLAFVDALQKKHAKQLGFFPRAQIEGYLRNGWMRIAEESGQWAVGSGQSKSEDNASSSSSLPTAHCPPPTRIGYVASRDRYLKRDELGAVFQLCVEPGRQRGLIGATLLKSAFDSAAYGCKLFCCWCAQDLAANHFWEAMGFTPIAFRAGSEKKRRIHLFWQKRIGRGDTTTPWWFPSQTTGGSIREDRLVLPIPLGTHWRDVMPIVLPGQSTAGATERALPAPTPRARAKTMPVPTRPSRQFGPPPVTPIAPIVPEPVAKVEKPKPAKRRHDPQLVSAARELRDRWLEQVNASSPALSVGKYDATRAAIEAERVTVRVIEPRLLAA